MRVQIFLLYLLVVYKCIFEKAVYKCSLSSLSASLLSVLMKSVPDHLQNCDVQKQKQNCIYASNTVFVEVGVNVNQFVC